MSYFQTEIPRPRPDHAGWLRTFLVGESREIDAEDKPSIKVSIHRENRRGLAKFSVKGLNVTRIK